MPAIFPFSVLSDFTAATASALAAATTLWYLLYRSRRASYLRGVSTANSDFAPSYLPVAIFVGGTAGIGQGMAEAFARHTRGNAQIIIIGRNRAAAESIISKFPKPTIAGVKHEFIQCDARLMKNVEQTTKALRNRLSRINFLVLSIGFINKISREDTEEGIDEKLALFYYSRWKFIHDLLPLLRNASAQGEAATVYSILAAGKGKEIDWSDLGLKKNYTVPNMRGQTSSYTDVVFQEFATRYPTVAFLHAWPGTVRTTLGQSAESLPLRVVFKLIPIITYPFNYSYVESGEYMLSGMLTIGKKPGMHRIEKDGREMRKRVYVATEEERRKLWQHTAQTTTVSKVE